ncbi:hypothetical protein C471_00140 [Halorubrum saccharovorum DSM 1137]|uniref:Uncharacterized protein n=1 Tax=Halorubrum saccharovorum DSM 1137 TaxID=1227484 RepID=M0E6T5_9EURY|nr:hypothetical protein C471_00140 [Halorubrum saccharovorum DSM 1137]
MKCLKQKVRGIADRISAEFGESATRTTPSFSSVATRSFSSVATRSTSRSCATGARRRPTPFREPVATAVSVSEMADVETEAF